MKDLFRGTLKIGIAIFGSLVALALIGSLIAWAAYAYKQHQVRPLEEVRYWQQDLTVPLQLKMSGRTKLVDGTMYGEFSFSGYPDYLRTFANTNNQNAGLSLNFNDKDGFEVLQHKLKLSEALTIVDQGKPQGLSYSFNRTVASETYARFQSIQVTWTLSTDAPAPVKNFFDQFDTKPDAVADHCAPDLSRAERMKRLAKLGTVRQVGDGEYVVGGHKLHWIGSLLYSCR